MSTQPKGRFWFRQNTRPVSCKSGLIGWPGKKPITRPKGNFNLAPSVAEADAILAKFGYVERELAAA